MTPIGGIRSEFLHQSVAFGLARDQSTANFGESLGHPDSRSAGVFSEGFFQFSAEVGLGDQTDDPAACERDTHWTSFVPKDPWPLTKSG